MSSICVYNILINHSESELTETDCKLSKIKTTEIPRTRNSQYLYVLQNVCKYQLAMSQDGKFSKKQ